MILLMSILLLSGCGSSEAPSGTIVTNQVVLEKATGKYQEMRHIVLKGTNQDIGAAIAKISREQYQAQSIHFPTIQDKLNRNSYIQQFFPYLAERQRGVESYYGWGSSDLNDSSALWYEIFPVNCSAVFFPKSVTSTGRSFMARDMDFYTVVLIVKMYGLRFLDYFGMMPRCSHTLRLMNFGADLFGPKVFQKELFLARGGISGRLQYSMSS